MEATTNGAKSKSDGHACKDPFGGRIGDVINVSILVGCIKT